MIQALQEGMRYLVDERRIVSGVAVGYGDADAYASQHTGSAREVRLRHGVFTPCPEPLESRSIFDLASVTKLFTALSVVLLRERGKLRFSDTVSRFDKRFSHIGDVTVYNLLCFKAGLVTPARIDMAQSRAQG